MIDVAIRIAVAAAVLVVLAGGSRALRRRHLPAWSGPPGVLAAVVMAISTTVLVAQVLGVIGLFSFLPLAGSLLAVGAVAWATARPRSTSQNTDRTTEVAEPRPRGRLDLRSAIPSILGVALVSAPWAARTALGLKGPIEVESIRYRLPISANFAQEHRITSLHWIDTHVGSLVAYYPHLSEMVHAIGIAFFTTEVASAFINPVLAALLLLAAWCIGRPYGVAPLSMMGALISLGTPDMVHMHAGSATNDVFAMAMFFAALAIWLNASHLPTSDARIPLVLSAAAMGMAVGIKYTFLPAFIATTAVVLVSSPSRTRSVRALIWLVCSAVMAAPWYLRNLFTVGNPVPAVRLSLGPIDLAEVPSGWETESLVPHLFDLTTWHDHLLPGLRTAWGPAFWAVGLLGAAALLAVLLRGADSLVRMYGGLALVVVVAFIVIPQPLGHAGDPFQSFTFNIRYMAHGTALALVLLPTVPLLSARARSVLAGVYLAVIAGTQLDATFWSASPFESGIAPPVTGRQALIGVAAGIAAAVLGLIFATTDWRRRVTAPVIGVLVLVTCLGSVAVESYYREHRLLNLREASAVIRWAHDAEGDVRLGNVGLQAQFAFFGATLDNRVEYLGDELDDGSFVRITNCRRWREVINDRDLTHVVTMPPLFSTAAPPEQGWTETDPAASVILRDGNAVVFEIDGDLDPDACSA